MQVMLVNWLLTAVAVTCIFHVHCNTLLSGNIEDALPRKDAFYGFKPCMDESCEYGPSELEPRPPYEGKIENPKVHCIMLRPSAVKMFGEIESTYPGISDIKYQLLEELIDHMYAFTSLKLENCLPAMQLIELIILAGNSLKAQYTLQGGEDCIYKSHENETEKPYPGEVTEMPCESGYVTGGSKICPGSTMKPYVPSSTTEKPYVPSSTEKHTEKPYVPSSTEKHTEKPYVPSSTKYPVTEKPYVPSTKHPATYEPSKIPCPDGVTTEKPCHPIITVTEEYSSEETEIIAEDEPEFIPQVGSMRGIPGVHYPNYTDIPITSFTCADKKYVPGFYADPETRCQVFHVCYEHRRESFLCPVGTIFNQPILACDYWYSSDCSVACDFYDVNEKTELEEEKIDEEVEELLTVISEGEKSEAHDTKPVDVESHLDEISQFFPVKAVVTEIKHEVKVPIATTPKHEEIASEIVDEMATTATKVISVAKEVVKSISEPVQTIYKPVEPITPIIKPVEQISFPDFKKPMKMQDLLKQAVVPIAKAKLAAIPVSKVTALKTAIPVATFTAKLATKVAAIPAIKVAAAVPVAKAAVAAPIVAKTKIIAAAPILAKAKIAVPAAKAAVAAPIVVKTKIVAAAPILAKAKVAVPAAKVAVAAPVLAKAKIAAVPAAKVAVAAPVIAKGKVAVPAVKMAAAKVAVKSSIPALKAKMFASAVPLAKAKVLPLMKSKVVKSAGTPLLKAKMLALPLAKGKLAGPLPIAKVKLAKAAAISPLTKKALALGYMKLLKAKKLALMG